MTEDTPDDIFRIDEPPEPTWFLRGDTWSWLFPIIGFCVFESLANPGIGIAVACLKFGYADFRTSVWLLGDKKTGRGGVHAPLYFARGCFITLFCSIVGWIVIAFFERQLIKNNPMAVLEALMISNLIVSLVGFCGGILATGIALNLIAHRRQRVWVDATIHESRRQKRWAAACYGNRNEFPLFCKAFIGMSVVWLAFVVISCLMGFIDPKQRADPVALRAVVCVLMFVVMGLPGAAALALAHRAWKFAADSPAQVWGEIGDA